MLISEAKAAMAKSSKDAYGASGSTNLLLFDPKDLTVVTDKRNPLYDERVDLGVSEALVVSIMTQGVLVPVTVRKNAESGKTEVVDGRQRVKATLEANRRLKKRGEPTLQIPAKVQKGSEDVIFGAMVATNEIRQADSPTVRAAKMQRAVGRGLTEQQIATIFGVTPATVKNLLGTLEASAPVRAALEAGKISASDAYKLSKMDPAEQKERLPKLLEHAPKAPGKRRERGAGAAARRARGDGGLRPHAEVMALLEEIEAVEAIRENDRKVAKAVLQWVLGADDALEAFYTRVSEKERDRQGESASVAETGR